MHAGGTEVTVLGPGPEDLAAMGSNLMSPTAAARCSDLAAHLARRPRRPSTLTRVASQLAAQDPGPTTGPRRHDPDTFSKAG